MCVWMSLTEWRIGSCLHHWWNYNRIGKAKNETMQVCEVVAYVGFGTRTSWCFLMNLFSLLREIRYCGSVSYSVFLISLICQFAMTSHLPCDITPPNSYLPFLCTTHPNGWPIHCSLGNIQDITRRFQHEMLQTVYIIYTIYIDKITTLYFDVNRCFLMTNSVKGI